MYKCKKFRQGQFVGENNHNVEFRCEMTHGRVTGMMASNVPEGTAQGLRASFEHDNARDFIAIRADDKHSYVVDAALKNPLFIHKVRTKDLDKVTFDYEDGKPEINTLAVGLTQKDKTAIGEIVHRGVAAIDGVAIEDAPAVAVVAEKPHQARVLSSDEAFARHNAQPTRANVLTA